MPTTPSAIPRLYELREVRELTRFSESKLLREIRDGRLPVIRFGRRTVVAETDLVAYIAERRQRGPDHAPLPLNDADPAVTGSTVRALSGGGTAEHEPG